ncbi:Peter Pan-like protein [Citrus sinensis]|uniref:Peter Pan-like protein n=2 Tax=Citrus sinensis TaxID=2711 RepID=A0ACB8I1X1_CITSI|nr:Peter Pan-like protein [Citrus sinensis]
MSDHIHALVFDEMKMKAAWFFQAACNGFKKVDAPTHIDLRIHEIQLYTWSLSQAPRPMGATHFLILSKTEAAPYLRVASAPRGPNLTLQVNLSAYQRIVLLNYNKKIQNSLILGIILLDYNLAGCGSESEADGEAATVALGSDLGRVIRASTKSAVRLQEIGRTVFW